MSPDPVEVLVLALAGFAAGYGVREWLDAKGPTELKWQSETIQYARHTFLPGSILIVPRQSQSASQRKHEHENGSNAHRQLANMGVATWVCRRLPGPRFEVA
jgi:hypothetical protein